jgi:uncharacterized protein YbgA (DUF1722 family)/uncharacterized protein YbbK (DUF523 family)
MSNSSDPSSSDTIFKIGVSSCLLGERVRFDGGHKRDHYLTEVLVQYFKFVPVCPELDVGMGVPRESVQLEGSPESSRMVALCSGEDWTNRMRRYSQHKVRQLARLGLCGYILKKNSPSCGMARVKVYDGSGRPSRAGRGLFAAELLDRLPLIPIEEEGRLNDLRLRENFIERVFAFDRLRQLFAPRVTRGRIVEFHSRHKYLLLAHSPQHYRELSRLVVAIKERPPAEFRDFYARQFMAALTMKTTTRKHVNVLQHIVGFLKDKLTTWEKQNVLQVIEDFRSGLLPLVVPLTLLHHLIDKHQIAFIQNQVYLAPHPKELQLRNHV